MKKVLSVIALAVMVCFAMTACGSSEPLVGEWGSNEWTTSSSGQLETPSDLSTLRIESDGTGTLEMNEKYWGEEGGENAFAWEFYKEETKNGTNIRYYDYFSLDDGERMGIIMYAEDEEYGEYVIFTIGESQMGYTRIN